MDIKSKEERSRNMAAIRSKNTKPEIIFRKKLFARGYRYSLNTKLIYGHPDLFLRKYNTAVFVNGCFWHRHKDCKYAYTPKSRIEFWTKKFASNVKRDQSVREALAQQKIKCLIVWECTIKRMSKNEAFCNEMLDRTEQFLHNSEKYLEL